MDQLPPPTPPPPASASVRSPAVPAGRDAEQRTTVCERSRIVAADLPGLRVRCDGLAVELLARARADHPALAALPDREQLLAAAWLASHRAARTRRAYAHDLAGWLGWLADHDVDVLDARRVHVDLWARAQVDAGAAASSITRRLSALSSFYRHATAHDLVTGNPVTGVQRPRVDPDHTTTVGLTHDQTRALLHAADTATGARTTRRYDHSRGSLDRHPTYALTAYLT